MSGSTGDEGARAGREAVEREMRRRDEDRDLVDTVSEEQRRERETVEEEDEAD